MTSMTVEMSLSEPVIWQEEEEYYKLYIGFILYWLYIIYLARRSDQLYRVPHAVFIVTRSSEEVIPRRLSREEDTLGC